MIWEKYVYRQRQWVINLCLENSNIISSVGRWINGGSSFQYTEERGMETESEETASLGWSSGTTDYHNDKMIATNNKQRDDDGKKSGLGHLPVIRGAKWFLNELQLLIVAKYLWNRGYFTAS